MLLGSGKVKNTTQSSNNHNPSVCPFILGKQAFGPGRNYFPHSTRTCIQLNSK